jgi:hypothetical protein
MKTSVSITILCIYCLACKDSLNEAPYETKGKITAAYRIARIDSMARSFGKQLGLRQITGGEISPVGTSAIWYYWFVESKPPYAGYHFQSTFDGVAFDGEVSNGLGIDIVDVDYGWFDSDLALMIAEKNGGRDFRNRHPNCTVQAALNESEFDRRTRWYISYRSKDDSNAWLELIIDANTGRMNGM